eukprot:jgi/Tetstr1/464510/TSEL_009268.t1
MIDFACVSSTNSTWSNDPRWCIPGIAATEAEHAKLAADRASSAPVQGVHRYYPFVVEDRGRLGKSALTVVYIFAVLLAVRNFPGSPSAPTSCFLRGQSVQALRNFVASQPAEFRRHLSHTAGAVATGLGLRACHKPAADQSRAADRGSPASVRVVVRTSEARQQAAGQQQQQQQRLSGTPRRGMSASGAAPTGGDFLGEALIPVVNRIQDIFNEISSPSSAPIDLPQVAVVGSQSSGKSSVLEALVGRDFLPRGPDICTRRPLVLQLVRMQGPGGAPSEWGEFLHAPGKRFYDFDRIRLEILAETDRVVGSNKGISDKPIRLRICSPHVLTMTLVDLPGITRVPVGDQPADIEERVRRMVHEFIAAPTAIILAVTAANSDLSNSDALQMARQVDPEGLRTIGVLTKLDIMDRGTDAADILHNKVVPLKLGYVGVVNRSQHDINMNKSVKAAREAEDAFFTSHPSYSGVLSRCSTATLAKALNSILVQHIAALLPSMRHSMEAQLNARVNEVAKYGESPAGASTAAHGAMLLRLVSEFADCFGQMVNGNYAALPTNTIAGGARIRYIFRDIFMAGLDRLAPAEDLSDEDIRTAIRNSGGVKGSLLIPEEPFELLTRRSLSALEGPALQCYEFVFEELLRMAEQCIPGDFARFPILERRARDAAQEFIAQGCGPTERMIRDLVAIEASYINTDHPDFVGGSNAVGQVLGARKEQAAAAAPGGEAQAGQAGERGAAGAAGRTSSGGPMPRLLAAAPPPHSAGSSAPGGLAPAGPSPAVVALRGSTVAHTAGASAQHRKAHSSSDSALGLKALESEMSQRLPEASEAGSGGGGWFSGLFGRAAPTPALYGTGGEPAYLADPPMVLHAGQSGTEQEHVEVEVTRLLVSSYFDIVRRNLQDSVPKAVMHFLVAHAQKGLQQHLIRELYKEDLFSEMMREREDISARRAQCLEQLSALRRALAALDQLPETLVRITREHNMLMPSMGVLSPPSGSASMPGGGHHRRPPAGNSFAARMASAALMLDRAGLASSSSSATSFASDSTARGNGGADENGGARRVDAYPISGMGTFN